MIWQPLNLTEVCPANTQLNACTYFGVYFLNLLVELYGGSQEQDKPRNVGRRENDVEEYDFIVVGAGSAGSVVASRLTEVEDWKVLLLEAGFEQPQITEVPGMSQVLYGSNIDWNYSTQPDGRSCLAYRNGRCGWSRGRVMGGSSTINTMVYVRGNKLDYDNWARMGNEGWSFEEVLPYFKKSERNLNLEGLDKKYHGSQGPQYISRYPYIDNPSIAVTEMFNEAGLPLVDINAANQLGTMAGQAFAVAGQRSSTNNAYIQPIRYKRENLIIKTESFATKILINRNKRAYGVRYTRNGKEYTAIAKKEVIVSGGAINSPQLLMLSGIGPRKHLEDLDIPVVKDLPVGRNLQDHLTFTGFMVAFDNKTSTAVSNQEMVEQVLEYHKSKVRQGPLSSSGPFNALAFFKTDPSLPAPNIQIQTQNIYLKEYIREPLDYLAVGIFPTVYYDAIIIRPQFLVPKSRGWLLLNKTDPYGPPLMYSNYFGEPDDIIPVQKAVKQLLSLENTPTFKSGKVRFVKVPLEDCKDTVWASDEYTDCMIRQYTFPLNHQAGSCKMGPKGDRTAVVDPRLKVHGIRGLRVIDASVMPVLVRGNTNGPTIMIGEKGSDMIKEDWGKAIDCLND